MSSFAVKRKRKVFIWLAAVVVVIAALVIACAVYLSDYYRADTEAIAAFARGTEWN